MNTLGNILYQVETESELAHEEMKRCITENPLQFYEAKGYARACEVILGIIRAHADI